jgi:hypothetical protein
MLETRTNWTAAMTYPSGYQVYQLDIASASHDVASPTFSVVGKSWAFVQVLGATAGQDDTMVRYHGTIAGSGTDGPANKTQLWFGAKPSLANTAKMYFSTMPVLIPNGTTILGSTSALQNLGIYKIDVRGAGLMQAYLIENATNVVLTIGLE